LDTVRILGVFLTLETIEVVACNALVTTVEITVLGTKFKGVTELVDQDKSRGTP
jgi:hypothetical protein